MKIIIDINHPAHVHYFKNAVNILRKKGHEILIVARDRKHVFELLNYYNEKYISRGKGADGLLKKLIYYPIALLKIIKITLKFKPDIFISFSTPYPHNIAKLFRKHSIAFNDTEHTNKTHKLFTYPYCDVICTPSCFYEDLGERHIVFNSFMELCYLHPKYFSPNPTVFKLLELSEKEDFVIIRFVSWSAHHDLGQGGIGAEYKRLLIEEIKKHAKVFISSEGELPEEFKKYQINIPSERMHDVLAYAKLFIGESGTMASECAVLGTPAIYVNSLPLMGYLKEEKENGLLFHFSNSDGVLDKALELLNIPNLKKEWQNRRQKMLSDKIDVTAFMVWFIENYPDSAKIMKENPDYQNKFK